MTYYPLVTNSRTELTDIRDYLKANKDIFDKIKPVMYDKTLSSVTVTKDANTQNNENIKRTLDVLENSAERLKNTYKFNYDMERNQHYATNTLKEQKLVMDDRYDRAVKSIDNNHRKYEIFQYYYLKNKTQLHILYVFLLYLGIMIVWTFIIIFLLLLRMVCIHLDLVFFRYCFLYMYVIVYTIYLEEVKSYLMNIIQPIGTHLLTKTLVEI